MNFGLRLKLSIMMVLQYAVWGAWAVPLASYMSGPLGFDGASVGWVYSTTAIAAIISPFFIGMVADRYFSTERCLGVFHLIGALFLYLASKTGSGEVTYLFSIMLLYSLCYMPTIALTNSLSFRNMSKPDQQFPGVRVFGTIGWILIGWVIGFKLFGLEEISAQPLLMASGLSVALGIFCFFLPHTPPMETASDVFGVLTKPLGMLKDKAFAIFVVVSFLISIVLAFYYQLANPFLHAIEAPNPQALQTSAS